MRMRLSLFHDQSVFMGEMADFFLFFKQKALLHNSVPLFFHPSSVSHVLPPLFCVELSHQRTLIASKVPLILEHPGSRLVLFSKD